MLEVADKCVGMPSDILGKAQQAFFTTKLPAEGAGLGLSMVSDIVTKHSGRIELDSCEGQFTNVKVLLPLVGDEGGL